MIFNSGFFKKASKGKERSREEVEDDWWIRVYKLWVREASAVWWWSCLSMALRIGIGLLCDIATYLESVKQGNGLTVVQHNLIEPLSVFVGWIMCLMPSKVSQQAPGFIFANPIILLWVKEKTRISPNLPSRTGEYMLGKISLLDFMTVIPVHFITTVSTAVFLQKLLPDSILPLALKPIQYEHDEYSLVMDMGREIFVTASFTVALHTLPVLFRLNKLPGWLLLWLFFPMFTYGVDKLETASAFAPNILMTLNLLSHVPNLLPLRQISCSFIGGLLGGKIMQVYFPDDDFKAKRAIE